MTEIIKKKDKIEKILLEIRSLIGYNHTGKVEIVLNMKSGTVVNCSLTTTKHIQ